MEYLKNIIFHFMCSDSYGRDQMLSPIATVLHFSPEEVYTYNGTSIIGTPLAKCREL